MINDLIWIMYHTCNRNRECNLESPNKLEPGVTRKNSLGASITPIACDSFVHSEETTLVTPGKS